MSASGAAIENLFAASPAARAADRSAAASPTIGDGDMTALATFKIPPAREAAFPLNTARITGAVKNLLFSRSVISMRTVGFTTLSVAM